MSVVANSMDIDTITTNIETNSMNIFMLATGVDTSSEAF
jgi:hypothetical protein